MILPVQNGHADFTVTISPESVPNCLSPMTTAYLNATVNDLS